MLCPKSPNTHFDLMQLTYASFYVNYCWSMIYVHQYLIKFLNMNLKSFFKPGLFAFSIFMFCIAQHSIAQRAKELRPGDTATGNFTFDSSGKTGLVCYRVTLNTERTGVVEKNTTNNIYIGRIPK